MSSVELTWHSRPSRVCSTGLVKLTPCVTISVPTWLAEVTIQRRRQAQECLAGCLMLSWVISAHLFQCSGPERPRRTSKSPVTSLSGPVCPHSEVGARAVPGFSRQRLLSEPTQQNPSPWGPGGPRVGMLQCRGQCAPLYLNRQHTSVGRRASCPGFDGCALACCPVSSSSQQGSTWDRPGFPWLISSHPTTVR